jgi:hypothetical protein
MNIAEFNEYCESLKTQEYKIIDDDPLYHLENLIGKETWLLCSINVPRLLALKRVLNPQDTSYKGNSRTVVIYHRPPELEKMKENEERLNKFSELVKGVHEVSKYYWSIKIGAHLTDIEEVAKALDVLRYWGLIFKREATWDETPRMTLIQNILAEIKGNQKEALAVETKAAMAQCNIAAYRESRKKMKKKHKKR